MLKNLLAPSSDCTSSDSASDSDTEAPMSFSDISELDVTEIAQHSDFNWFAVTETMESNGYTKIQLEELFSSVLSSMRTFPLLNRSPLQIVKLNM